MEHYGAQTRRDVENKIDVEIAKVGDERKSLLRSIFESLHIADFSESARLQMTIARFATLLVALSAQADRIQRWMVGLTVAIAIMTLVLVVLTIVMLTKM
jgi:hypothetical protein